MTTTPIRRDALLDRSAGSRIGIGVVVQYTSGFQLFLRPEGGFGRVVMSSPAIQSLGVSRSGRAWR